MKYHGNKLFKWAIPAYFSFIAVILRNKIGRLQQNLNLDLQILREAR